MNWNRNLSTINIRTILNCNIVANISHKIILYFFLSCLVLVIINLYILDMFKTNQRKETMTNKEIIKKGIELFNNHFPNDKHTTDKEKISLIKFFIELHKLRSKNK